MRTLAHRHAHAKMAAYPKASHRHAKDYVERQGSGTSVKKHQHADGTIHDDHAVAPNEYNNPEPDGWQEPTIAHFRPSKETADVAPSRVVRQRNDDDVQRYPR